MGTLSQHPLSPRHKLTNIAYGLLLGGLASITSFNYFHSRISQPYTDIKVTTPNAKVLQGDPLLIVVSGERLRICAVSVSRAILNRDTGTMVHQESVPAGFVPIGPFSVPVAIQLPIWMTIGHYTFRGLQINDCGDEVISIPYPPLNFEIVNQG